MKSIDTLTYTSNVNIENSHTSIPQGEMEQTMELFENDEGALFIEWDIPDMDQTEHMGLELEGKNVVGYDGVFELPAKAIELLERNGYNCDEVNTDF